MKRTGFSLIEILITVAIIGILTTLLYPNYTRYMIKTRRLDGHTALLTLAAHLESYYSKNHTYTKATVIKLLGTQYSLERHYILSIPNLSNDTYTLAATPQETQTKDTTCQTLTLDYLGQKGIMAGPGGAPMGAVGDCW